MVSSTYLLATAIAVILALWNRRRRSRFPYPPGPPIEPILGHLRVMPASDTEKVFREWSKEYGDLLYLRIPGRSYLILNSLNVATELLDKRSGINSDRMRLILFDIMGWYPCVPFLQYGKRFQKHRQLLHEYLHQRQCISYHPLQTKQARRLLVHILDDQNNCVNYFQWFSTSIISKIAYGVDLAHDDPFIDISNKGLKAAISCGPVGSTIVDFFPILRFCPSWFPGTYYAFKAASLRSAVREMHEHLFNRVKQQLKDGTAEPSYVSSYLDELQGDYTDIEHLDDIEGSAGAMFAGGAETTRSVLWYFLFAMVLFPEFQTKAQEEIDQLLGKSRLPEITDRSSLPYVTAIINEVHRYVQKSQPDTMIIQGPVLRRRRWNTVAPLGIPHRSIEDDVYNGMFIPKGTILIPNAYAILRDDAVYADPDTFDPSRYLPKPKGNAEPYPIGQFGFGRRICPGQYLSDGSLWIAIASILATFNIGRALDENEREIIPEVEIIVGLSSHPKPFPFTIRPRDDISERLIRQAQLWNDN